MHIITLSFDDGFLKSTLKTAEIYEKHGFSAAFNVIATGHEKTFVSPDKWQDNIPKGDFKLWNELQDRGHEIMPHGYKHANKAKLPFEKAQELITKCLNVFSKELKGFNPKESIFNFPYNASTPELEKWLLTQVKALRIERATAFNPLPYPGQTIIPVMGNGPGNCDQQLDELIEKFLATPSGWLVYVGHGLDDEGWGPLSADYLDRLLGRLKSVPSVRILPKRRALALADYKKT